MRAQLRTYHSIPSLQAHQDPNAYKQLQDAPRLKSILKGATEDTEQPATLEDIKAAAVPRTNPVNLIFVLAQYAPKISDMHFDVPRDFFDLVVKSNLSSRSRATAFLWLMWWYLESDFSEKDALNNPYGPGRKSKPDDANEMPLKCPQFEILDEQQEDAENVDTTAEREFGLLKQEERRAILAADMAPIITGAKRTGKRTGTGNTYTNNPVFQVASEDGGMSSPSRDPNSPAAPPPPRGGFKSKPLGGGIKGEYPSDTDRTRSASPVPFQRPPPPQNLRPHEGGQMGMFKPTTGGMRITAMLNQPADDSAPKGGDADAGTTSSKSKGPGRGNWRRPKGEGATPTPRSAASSKSKAQATAVDQADTASVASATSAHHQPPPRSDSTAGAIAGSVVNGPHGFYLPLDGSGVVPKRSRPLTHHQIAVEQFRRQKVNYILYQSMQKDQKQATKKRKRSSGFLMAWQRTVDTMGEVGDKLYDSEDEERVLRAKAAAAEAESNNGNGQGAVEDPLASKHAMTMAGLRNASWEDDDFGAFSGKLASGLRRATRRLDRWEKGLKVVRSKTKKMKTVERGEMERDAEQGRKRRTQDGEGVPASSPLGDHGEGEGDEEVDVDEMLEREIMMMDEEEMDEDGDDNETIDAMDGLQDEVMAGV
jgi:Ino eighty subunit 1